MQFHPQTAARLAELYRRLRQHFDYAHPWWPGNPFQIAITAVLVQQCDWSIAWEAIGRLEREGIENVSDLADLSPEKLQELIKNVSFAPTKSVRLVAIARRVQSDGFDSFERFLSPERGTKLVRDEILALPGIGPETADCLLNFASEHPVFVVDAYTRRVFDRLNLVPHLPPGFWKKGRYEALQEFFQSHLLTGLSLYDDFAFPGDLPRDVALLRDYHAMLVELGKHHCIKTNPRCHQTGKPGWPDYEHCVSHCLPNECPACPLAGLCRFSMKS
jgi:endonuclease III related protein